MNLMTKDDFPGERRGRQNGDVERERGRGGDGDGGRGYAPTEREPSTAIFRFFKMSPVIGESSREREGGEGGSGRGLKEGRDYK